LAERDCVGDQSQQHGQTEGLSSGSSPLLAAKIHKSRKKNEQAEPCPQLDNRRRQGQHMLLDFEFGRAEMDEQVMLRPTGTKLTEQLFLSRLSFCVVCEFLRPIMGFPSIVQILISRPPDFQVPCVVAYEWSG